MEFHNKLIFLMNITQTSNKELAQTLNVDPSLISLFRSGKRKPPRNESYIQNMSGFFAKRCPAAFQRNALSELMNQSSVNLSMPAEELALRISTWLSEGSGLADHFFSELSELPQTSPVSLKKDTTANDFFAAPPKTIPSANLKTAPVSLPEQIAPTDNTRFFFGESGRKEALNRLMELALRSTTPGTLLISSDDNLEWLLTDYTLTKETQTYMSQLIEKGFFLYQIMPPLNYLSRFAEALNFWLPVYSSGQIQIFYYPRPRDNLCRQSMLIIPGVGARISYALGLDNDTDITLLTTDETLLQAYTNQFKAHMGLCKPAITAHTQFRDFLNLFKEGLLRKGSMCNIASNLAAWTMSAELFEHFLKTTSGVVNELPTEEITQLLSIMNSELNERAYIDMSPLATPKEVRAGKVPVGFPFSLCSDPPMYTPQTYVLHLKNILRLLEQYDNFYFVPAGRNRSEGFDLFVNSEGPAMLIRPSSSPVMLEMQRPELVLACHEYLLHKAESVGYSGIHRETSRMMIQKLIKDLS